MWMYVCVLFLLGRWASTLSSFFTRKNTFAETISLVGCMWTPTCCTRFAPLTLPTFHHPIISSHNVLQSRWRFFVYCAICDVNVCVLLHVLGPDSACGDTHGCTWYRLVAAAARIWSGSMGWGGSSPAITTRATRALRSQRCGPARRSKRVEGSHVMALTRWRKNRKHWYTADIVCDNDTVSDCAIEQ